MYFVPVSQTLPQEAYELNQQISNQYDDKYEYAQALFYEIEPKWTSPVRQYLLEPHKPFFMKSAKYYWAMESEYAPSNLQAQIYRNLLIQDRFTEQEVEYITGFCGNSPHGYLKITHPEKQVYVDLWAVDDFEEYKFGQYTHRPCEELSGVALFD